MFKRVTLSVASIALILSGCGVKEEYKKGVELYNKGGYENLVKAREFFNNYSKKHPDDSGVEEWFNKIDTALVEQAKKLANDSYSKKENIKAMEYIKIARAGAPNDKSVTAAYKVVKKGYNQQKAYDNFAGYLEDRYIDTKVIVNQFDSAMRMVKTGQQNYQYIGTVSKNLYPSVVELREKINSETFSISGSGKDTFRTINTDLFTYVVSLEQELTNIMNADVESVDEYDYLVKNLSPESFNTTFIALQQSMTDYVQKQTADNKPVTNIKDTLNFTKAYDKKVSEEQKKAAESIKGTPEANK